MHIKRIDRELFILIKSGKVTDINIRARFNTSMSGYSCGYFITILNDTKELLPMSLVLSGRIVDNRLQKVERITISDNQNSTLIFDDRTLIEDLHVYETKQINLTEQYLDRFINFLQDSALNDGFYPFLSNSNMLKLTQRAENRLLGSENFFLEKLNSFFTCLKSGDLSISPNIIGFGPGLTPSSDDFLLGLLSAFFYSGDNRSKTLCQYINEHKEKTTEVSKWMLHYAVTYRLFPMIVKRFYQTEGNNLDEFLTHGGTSGMDLLSGICTGLFLIIFDEGLGKWGTEL